MKIRDEKGKVTAEIGFFEMTGEVAEAGAAAGLGLAIVAGVGGAIYLSVLGAAKGVQYVANKVADWTSSEKAKEEGTTETETDGKGEQPDLHKTVTDLAELAEGLKNSFESLSETVEQMKKSKKAA
jgi:hypothetical protein